MIRQGTKGLLFLVAFVVVIGGGGMVRAIAVQGEPLSGDLVRQAARMALIFAAGGFVLGRVVAALNCRFPRGQD